MSIFPANTRSYFRVLVLSAMLVVCTAGCTPAMHTYVQRPTLLARDWLDLKKTTAADTSVWRLSSSGDDLTLHVLSNVTTSEGVVAQERVTRHGIWYLQGDLADTTARSLCFNGRPGRAPSSCIAFQVDTMIDGRLRLRLRNYVGTHETAARTLEERRR